MFYVVQLYCDVTLNIINVWRKSVCTELRGENPACYKDAHNFLTGHTLSVCMYIVPKKNVNESNYTQF